MVNMTSLFVQQASFKPLGITIAVAKDRAIESLMQVSRLLSESSLHRWQQNYMIAALCILLCLVPTPKLYIFAGG